MLSSNNDTIFWLKLRMKEYTWYIILQSYTSQISWKRKRLYNFYNIKNNRAINLCLNLRAAARIPLERINWSRNPSFWITLHNSKPNQSLGVSPAEINRDRPARSSRSLDERIPLISPSFSQNRLDNIFKELNDSAEREVSGWSGRAARNAGYHPSSWQKLNRRQK